MMHAMGFHHEQSRPDRDQFVEIRKENIIDRFESNFDIATNTVPDYAISVSYDPLFILSNLIHASSFLYKNFGFSQTYKYL